MGFLRKFCARIALQIRRISSLRLLIFLGIALTLAFPDPRSLLVHSYKINSGPPDNPSDLGITCTPSANTNQIPASVDVPASAISPGAYFLSHLIGNEILPMPASVTLVNEIKLPEGVSQASLDNGAGAISVKVQYPEASNSETELYTRPGQRKTVILNPENGHPVLETPIVRGVYAKGDIGGQFTIFDFTNMANSRIEVVTVLDWQVLLRNFIICILGVMVLVQLVTTFFEKLILKRAE